MLCYAISCQFVMPPAVFCFFFLILETGGCFILRRRVFIALCVRQDKTMVVCGSGEKQEVCPVSFLENTHSPITSSVSVMLSYGRDLTHSQSIREVN